MNKESGKRKAGHMRRAALMLAMVAALAACGEPEEQVVADFGIAYIKRPIPVDIDDVTMEETLIDTDVREPLDFFEGGDVYLRDRASPSATEKNITECITDGPDGQGDVRDLEVNYEGTKLIFSARDFDPNPNDDDVPSWDIYEYDIAAGGCPQRVIDQDIIAEKGHDLAPHYLPDGRIVFSSSRQKQGKESLLNEGKQGYPGLDENARGEAIVLHVMGADGKSDSIKQISFNQSHDFDPTVLQSGEILFSRWDNMGSRSGVHLYKVRPDGTELKALYGVHNHDVGTGGSTVQYLAPRELDDGKILAMLKPFTGSARGGAPVIIDAENYAEYDGASWANRDPLTGNPLITGNGHQSAITLDLRTDGSISPAGRYRHLYPLGDGTNRALVSWSQCRLEKTDGSIIPCPGSIPTDAVEAFPLYGIYIYDMGKKTQLPVVIPQEGFIYEEPVVLAPRDKPEIIYDKDLGYGLDQNLAGETVGLLHIRSIYDMDGFFDPLGGSAATLAEMADPALTTADARPARFLRIVKAVPIPDDTVRDIDNSAYGRSTGQRMREIIGYVPIEPDGSVLTKVPANVPFAISVVDKDGRRISARHQNWLQVLPGETLECNGCHDHSSDLPHGFVDGPAALNSGATTTAFPGTDTAIVATPGETMAQTRIANLCTGVTAVLCPELSPSVNLLEYADYWTDATGGLSTPTVDIKYEDLGTPDAPASTNCQDEWSFNCRIIANYPTHIHPLWSLPRADPANADPSNTDWTCTNANCHSRVDDMGAIAVPQGQLELTDGPSIDEPDHLNAYRELMFADDNLILDMGALVVETEIRLDANNEPVCKTNANGEPIDAAGNPLDPNDPNLTSLCDPETDPVSAPGPSMSVNGSHSGDFIDFMMTDSQHAGMLGAAELRLISEWLDIGGQYYNNPFDAPEN